MRLNPGRPSFIPLVKIRNVDDVFDILAGLDHLAGGVGVFGEAAAYALVWELGSRRLKSPGPKTVWGTNRYGERVILTKQAPTGYVTPVDGFWNIIMEEIQKVDFSKAKNSKEMSILAEVALDNASQSIARIISQRAPIDEGTLRSEIQGIDSDAIDLNSDADLEASGTLIL